jgi:hypothetical protein
MIDIVTSIDRSSHFDRLIQLGRRAVREAQEQSRQLGVANVYSINGKLFYELPNGAYSPTPPLPIQKTPTKPLQQGGGSGAN